MWDTIKANKAVMDEMKRYSIDITKYHVTYSEPPSGQDHYGMVQMRSDTAAIWGRVYLENDNYRAEIELV